MKKLKLNLLLHLLKKDFLFHKDKNRFLILNYDFIIKSIKQFLRLKLLVGLPVYILSKEKKQNIFLKKYFINYLKRYDIQIIENQIITKESVCIIINSKSLKHKNNNLEFKLDNYKEGLGFNLYKIFIDLANLKKLLFLIVILRRIYEKI